MRLPHVGALFSQRPKLTMAVIDISIGLSEAIGAKGQNGWCAPCWENGNPACSVPSRGAVMAGLGRGQGQADVYEDEASRYRAACDYALAYSKPPRKVSKKSFHLFPKMAEVNTLLRNQADMQRGCISATRK